MMYSTCDKTVTQTVPQTMDDNKQVVLIIEDELPLRRFLRRLLTAYGILKASNFVQGNSYETTTRFYASRPAVGALDGRDAGLGRQ